MTLRWSEEEYEDWLSRNKHPRANRPTLSAANVEPNPVDGSSSKNADKEIHPRVRIHIHSRRRRLCDPDGISAKAAIDGLVKGGLLADDSAKYIDAVTFSQERAETDETIITVEELKEP